VGVQTVLVTGGAGFIGSHACKALACAGHRPVAFDNLERGHTWAVKWGPLARGDVRSAGDLRAAFAEYCPDAVMHFAALAYVGESNLEPLEYYDNNVGGVIALARACVDFNCRRVIFSSSCAAYGAPESGPIAESAALSPINPYGWSKLMGERVLSDAGARMGCAAWRFATSTPREAIRTARSGKATNPKRICYR
jgi:UDP-arabinose 4-epimerase